MAVAARTLLFCLVACNGKPAPVDTTASSLSPTTSAIATVAVSASASVPSRPRRLTPREIVDAWNDAHTKHDVKALESLYAPHVKFYGQTLTNKQAAAAKKAAFAKSPDYAQTIRDVAVGEDGVVTFTKTSTSGGKSTDYPAVLVVMGQVVSAETDKVTEANLALRAVHDDLWCAYGAAESFFPNETVVPPCRFSAIQAAQRAMRSKHVQDLAKSDPKAALGYEQVSCPTKQDLAQGSCTFSLRMVDAASTSLSRLVEWTNVDAVHETLTPQSENAKSEPLPP